MTDLLALREVSRRYDGGRVVALVNVSVSIAPGETVALTGRSGSGKSTLVHLMAGLDVPSSGSVRFRDREISGAPAWARLRAHEIGIVFQAFNLLPTLDALRNIMVPMLGVEPDTERRRSRARELLERVGLAARAGHRPAEMSGGERQRVAIARCLANRPALVLADEPTGNLDSGNARAVTDLLLQVCADNGSALVIATHDPTVADRLTRRIELLDGRVVNDAAAARRAD